MLSQGLCGNVYPWTWPWGTYVTRRILRQRPLGVYSATLPPQSQGERLRTYKAPKAEQQRSGPGIADAALADGAEIPARAHPPPGGGRGRKSRFAHETQGYMAGGHETTR